MSDISSQWKESSTAFDAMLLRMVDIAAQWIDALDDPEIGPVGAGFAARLKQTGYEEEFAVKKYTRALYNSYSVLSGDSGFHNSLLYGWLALTNLDELVCARVHESRHCMQMQETPALHASPFNPDTKVVLCPEDWLFLNERCEQSAYAGQVWFMSLLADLTQADSDLNRKILRTSEFEPVSVSAFRELRERTGSLHAALVEAARSSLQKRFYTGTGSLDYYLFSDNYADNALTGYAQVMNVRRNDNKEKGFVYVRLSPEEREAAVRAIGGIFGPNCFTGPDGKVLPEFLEGVKLSENVNSRVAVLSPKARLAELNQILGIDESGKLPTLADALAEKQMTPESMKIAAYASVIHVKPREIIPQSPSP
jgi:hypothetical protein